ncbi:receptor-interacting serine/threonine-protein kinase 3-like isoform 1-T2 [Pholidichthys leucotaenia]
MALQNLKSGPISDESLENWKYIGCGGFGDVYKARHKDWKFDVAIKLARDNAGLSKSSLAMLEAKHMNTASCEFVLRVYGLYQGLKPSGGLLMQQGIVMEFMAGGSIQTLQETLSGPPPWPLAFRLAHEVALGMNFLHSHGILHRDLKPSNVLLNDDLHAKLADFGLSMVSNSALNSPPQKSGGVAGSYKYMPPEAFDVHYEPSRAYDRYSYGILLWAIVNGKEPYPGGHDFTAVELNVCQLKKRPRCDDIDKMDVEGLTELVVLMKECWDEEPSKRPQFKGFGTLPFTYKIQLKEGAQPVVHAPRRVPAPLREALKRELDRMTNMGVIKKVQEPTDWVNSIVVTKKKNAIQGVTENVYSKHKGGILKALFQVTKNLEPDSSNYSNRSGPSSFIPQMAEPLESSDTVNLPRFTEQGNAPILSTRNLTDKDKVKFVEDNRAHLIQNVSEVMAIVDVLGNMVHSETYSRIEAKDTTQDQMRELYQRVLCSGREKIKVAFYDALRKHYPDLV